jgi:hypothetical protein
VMFEYGADFDEHPAVGAIMRDQSIPPDYLIEVLWQQLPRRVWEELLILADEESWPDFEDTTDEAV